MVSKSHISGEPGEIYWRYSVPPNKDAKMSLLTIGNVNVTGVWYGELGQYFKAWAPMPKRDRQLEKELFGDKG